MQRIFSLILSVVLTAYSMPASAGGREPREQAMAIRTGSPVEVRLTDNTRIRGRLVAITDLEVELQTVNQAERIPFDKVKSVRNTKTKSFGGSVARGFLIAGITTVIVGVVFGVVCGKNACSE